VLTELARVNIVANAIDRFAVCIGRERKRESWRGAQEVGLNNSRAEDRRKGGSRLFADRLPKEFREMH
jgi:hypothetical protein